MKRVCADTGNARCVCEGAVSAVEAEADEDEGDDDEEDRMMSCVMPRTLRPVYTASELSD